MEVIRNAPLLTRFVALVLLPLLVGGWFFYKSLVHSLPEQRMTLVQGVSAPVSIVRDLHGVPRIDAKTDADAFFAIGYVHAQDRLWQLEVQRHLAQGRLSELFGRESVPRDVWFRTLGLYDAAKTAWPALSKESQAALTAYTAGINASVAAQTSLPVEFRMLGVKPTPWTVYDSLAWIKVFALNLSVSLNSEMNRTIASQALDAQRFKTLFPDYGEGAPTTIRAASKDVLSGAAIASMKAFQKTELELGLGLGGQGIGSNAWVVSGKHTGGQGALLANDPHLNLQVPSLWYVISAKGATLDVNGMSMVGLPLVIFGHNANIAWGGTNMMADAQDLYFERPDPSDVSRYELNGKMVAYTTRVESIAVRPDFPVFLSKEIKPLQVSVRSSVHGPILSDQFKVFDQPVALRWTALDAGDTSFEAFYRLNFASDWDGFNKALSALVAPALNIVYADRQGNIGYLGAGRIPVRKAGNGSVPAPGWNDDKAWTGFIPFDQLPRTYNPESGYIVTANNKIVDDSYQFFLSNDWAPAARARRIEQLLRGQLENKKPLVAQDMQRMQGDTVDLEALAMLPELLKVKPENALQRTALAYLKSWNGDMSRDSQAAAIFTFWMRHFRLALFDGERKGSWDKPEQHDVVQALSGQVSYDTLRKVLVGSDSGWCQGSKVGKRESCHRMLQLSLQAALGELYSLRGDESMASWKWGTLQNAVFTHTPFSQIKPFNQFFERKVPTGGSINTINVAGSSFEDKKGFMQGLGAGFRQVVTLGKDKVSMSYMNSTGQSGNLLSDHYDDMVEPFRDVAFYQIAPSVSPARTGEASATNTSVQKQGALQ
ncbi:penicillin acylase family protein [Massilia sp. TSP1-1-2]|uniref:penicillin acylase family protein n=1 Tax=Massilia sp. TSP1-1-2 TaxID=2804649 RepID=UPI003CEA900B